MTLTDHVAEFANAGDPAEFVAQAEAAAELARQLGRDDLGRPFTRFTPSLADLPAGMTWTPYIPGAELQIDGVTPVEMRDAADWNAPGLNGWQGPVQGYPNRQTKPWPPAAFRKFTRVMRTSVQRPAMWAEICRELDIEALAAEPADLPPFVRIREAHGHHDATAYFSVSRWPEVHGELIANGITPDRLRLRVAWWTGRPAHINLGGGWLAWAHQFANVPALGIDRSMVYGPQDFDNPRIPDRTTAAYGG